MADIVVEQRISAPPSVVYEYLTDSEKWARWQGIGATIDARSGGIFALAMPNGMKARGQFVELVPDERVVFTWGWIDRPGLPPGSTTVEIELQFDGEATLLVLTHRALPDEEVTVHRLGWAHYLPRLASVARGGDPGPDSGPS